MNHLAHSFLSCNDAELLIGNLIADFISIKEVKSLHFSYKKGVSLHRAIDRYMDGHPLTKEAIKILKPSQGKYAPVSIDLLWDHYLCLHWDKYTDQEYINYCQWIYQMIESGTNELEASHAARFQKLISYNFIGQYQDPDSFIRVLKRMDNRAKFPSNFKELLLVSEANQEDLDQLFNEFFPQALAYTTEFCNS